MFWFDIADELLPPVYRAIKDMYAYARTLDTQLRQSLTDMMAVRQNFFIQTCDIETIEYWESLLGITLYGGETIEDRRQMIMIYLNNRYPTSEPYVRSVMNTLFGQENYDIEFDAYDPFLIRMHIFDSPYDSIKRFWDWFLKARPAHIIFTKSYTERAYGEIFVSSISPSQYMSKATASVVFGTGTVWLGSTQYTLNTMDL